MTRIESGNPHSPIRLGTMKVTSITSNVASAWLVLMTVSCGPPPKLSSVSIAPATPMSNQEYVATTNLPDGKNIFAEVRDISGRDHGMYVPTIARGQLSLQLDLPAGTYDVVFVAPSCFPIKRTVKTGLRVPVTHLEFVFGDIDRDGRVTRADIGHLKRWQGRDTTSRPTEADLNRRLMLWNADWDDDGLISARDLDEATRNLGRTP